MPSAAQPLVSNLEVVRLREQVRRLVQEKSALQLVNDLMAKLGQVAGLDNTAEALVRLVGETIGGWNLTLFYPVDGVVRAVDVAGVRSEWPELSDELVTRAMAQHHVAEEAGHRASTRMTEPGAATAYSWANPLLVGDELVGVLKAEDILIRAEDVERHLGPFFTYAGLVLKNEVTRHSRLVETNQRLQLSNDRLTGEMAERLRQQRFLEALLESLNAVIVACDERGVVTFVNRTCRSVRELPDGALSASDFVPYFGLHLADGRTAMGPADSPLVRALAGQRVDQVETVLRVSGHPGASYLASGRPISDEQGTTMGAVMVMQDISDRKQLESQLRHSQKLEAVGQLAAGIAHELNTPAQFVGDSIAFLANAMGDLLALVARYQSLVGQMMAGSMSEDEVARLLLEEDEVADVGFLRDNIPAAIDRVRDGMSRIAGIVRAMKEFAHPDAKEQSPADLNHALAATLTIARNEYKYVAEVETDFGQLPLVTCRVGELNQVFLNLVVNAAHAIAEVVGTSGDKGLIRVTTRQLGEQVQVEVADTGCGIPESIRERVFDPFFTTKEVGRGSGQGLAIARSIVVGKHGGTLTFETVPGKGTTFTVMLPIHGVHGSAAGVTG